MKDQVIRRGTLQVSKSNCMSLQLHLTNEWQTTFATTLHRVAQSLYLFKHKTELLNNSILVFILKGSANHDRPHSSVEYAQLPFVVATPEINCC